MSNSSAIYDLSKTLANMLYTQLNQPGRPITITVDSPLKENQDEPRLNLFLYQINQDPFRRNSNRIPLETTTDPVTGVKTQTWAAEPLPLTCFYLLTAFAQDGLTEHRLLGEAIQLFYSNQYIPEVYLEGSLRTSPIRATRIQMVLQNLELSAHNMIWGSNTQMRTSVGYEVSVVFIDSTAAEAPSKLAEEVVSDVVPVPYLSYLYPEAAAPGDNVKIYGANLALPWLKIWFGEAVAAPLPGAKSTVAQTTVPTSLTSGSTVDVKLQLDSYFSSSREFLVL